MHQISISKMKKLLFSAITLLLATLAGAQSIERQVYASGGAYAVSPNLTLSYTVGEPVVATLFSTKLILTQGFQQPLETDTPFTVSVNTDIANWSINAFPNPFNESINVEVGTDKTADFTISVRNLLGQNLGLDLEANQYPGKKVYTLSTAALAQGMYIVTISANNGKSYRSFKLNKVY